MASEMNCDNLGVMPRKVLDKLIEQAEGSLRLVEALGVRELSREAVEPGYRRKSELLRKLQEEIGDCQRCQLSQSRKLVVFGEGDPESEVFLVGEAPGESEDETGRPFVGAAGRILTDIIERGMKLKRSRVFIANVVKCRPPKNRDPEPSEVDACRGFLEKQLKIVNPRVIIALGKIATQCLLKTTESITHLRGMWSEFLGIPVMPTYHPAYLLHNPSGKRELWSDIKKVLALLAEERK